MIMNTLFFTIMLIMNTLFFTIMFHLKLLDVFLMPDIRDIATVLKEFFLIIIEALLKPPPGLKADDEVSAVRLDRVLGRLIPRLLKSMTLSVNALDLNKIKKKYAKYIFIIVIISYVALCLSNSKRRIH